jgi:hypothetical protein
MKTTGSWRRGNPLVRIASTLGIASAMLLAIAGPARAIQPMEGDTFPEHQVVSHTVGHLSGMLAGPFDGPCSVPQESTPISDAESGHPGIRSYTRDQRGTYFSLKLLGKQGEVSPIYSCRPGFYNGRSNSDAQPIYAVEKGKATAVYDHSFDRQSCCGTSIGYYQTEADTAASFDDSELVHFTIVAAEPAKRFTDAEKASFSRKSGVLGVDAGASGAVALACGLTPEPAVSKVCALVAALEGIGSGIAGGVYSILAADPIDRGYKTVAKPKRLSPPSYGGDGLPADVATALDRWQADIAKETSIGDALDTAINRSQGARVAHDRASEGRQMTAARAAARMLATVIASEETDRTAVAAALRAAGIPDVSATAAQAEEAQHNNFTPQGPSDMSTNPGPGISADVNGRLRALAPSQRLLTRAKSVLSVGPLPAGTSSLYGLLGSAPNDVDRSARGALGSFAARKPRLG